MFIVASNYGSPTPSTIRPSQLDTGGLRLFEIEPKPLTSALTSYAANQLLLKVRTTGVAGAAYAQWLAENRKDVSPAQEVVTTSTAEFAFSARALWALTMTLYVGAVLANACDFTASTCRCVPLGTALARRAAIMRDYFTLATASTRAASWASCGWSSTSQPDLHGNDPLLRDGPAGARVDRDTGTRRCRTSGLSMGCATAAGACWCGSSTVAQEARAQPRAVQDMLKDHFIVTQSKQSIGAGVLGLDAASGRAECLDLTLSCAPSHGSDEQT